MQGHGGVNAGPGFFIVICYSYIIKSANMVGHIGAVAIMLVIAIG